MLQQLILVALVAGCDVPAAPDVPFVVSYVGIESSGACAHVPVTAAGQLCAAISGIDGSSFVVQPGDQIEFAFSGGQTGPEKVFVIRYSEGQTVPYLRLGAVPPPGNYAVNFSLVSGRYRREEGGRSRWGPDTPFTVAP